MSAPTPSGPSRGIVYVAMGERFVSEAAVSAASARRHVGVPITIFTDAPDVARATDCFDDIVALVRSGIRAHRDKLVAFRQLPYDQTLFLDTDTFVALPIDGFWELLDHFDLAATADRGYKDEFPAGSTVPSTYKEINTGVLLMRRSEALDRVVAAALDHYDELVAGMAPGEHFKYYDQTALRLALYGSGMRIVPLPEEDNCRFATYGKLNGPVRILHGRHRRAENTRANLQRTADRLNVTAAPRVFVAGRLWALMPQRVPVISTFRHQRMRSFRRVDPIQLSMTVARIVVRRARNARQKG